MNRNDMLSYGYLAAKGILANFRSFKSDRTDKICYDFSCMQFKELKEKYRISEISGQGDNYTRAKRLLIHFSKRMAHDSMYDNHVECNSLALLDYCYENPMHGINCLNKAKVLTECCLSIGIPARRVSIIPFSPYDDDSHVVTEIYDELNKKWVMMDPTLGGIFVDSERTPLSLLEIREHFADNAFITFCSATGRTKDLNVLEKKELESNWYICKNSFYFMTQKYQGFGSREDDRLYFIPVGYSVLDNMIANCRFRLDNISDEYPKAKEIIKTRLYVAENSTEPAGTDIQVLLAAPEEHRCRY